MRAFLLRTFSMRRSLILESPIPRFSIRRSLRLVLGTLVLAGCWLPAQPAIAQDETAAIQAVLTRQAANWNRGDLDAFASGYKRSPDILFMGKTIAHGYDGMLATYKAHYPTKESQGRLSFSDLAVQPLDARFATVTGRFHLERTAHGGGNADGYFLLVMEKTGDGWKIVRDDTTAAPPPPH